MVAREGRKRRRIEEGGEGRPNSNTNRFERGISRKGGDTGRKICQKL